MKKILIIVGCLIVSIIVFYFAYPKEKKEATVEQTLTAIQFSDDLIVLEPDGTFKTTITQYPEATAEKISYIINDDNVASVTEKGVVTGKNEGVAVLTAISESGKTAETSIVVKTKEKKNSDVLVEQININSQNINLLPGQSYKIESEILPSDATDKTITYTTTDEQVASVSGGIIKANKVGNAIITLTSSNGISSSVMVNVTSTTISISNIKIFPSEANLQIGESLSLNLIYTPSNATNKSAVTWTSSNNSIVEVENGVITAKQIGTVVITASLNGKTSTSNINVESKVSASNIAIKSLNLSKSEVSLMVGKTSQIQYNITPSNATNKALSFNSSDNKIFTVSNTGLVKGIGIGVGILTVCSNNGICEKVSIKVTNNIVLPESIYLNIEQVTLKKGEEKQLRATVLPLNSTTNNLIWVTGSSQIVSVSDTGLIKAISYGNTTVSVITTNGKVAKVKVNVLQDNPDFPYGEILVRSEVVPSGNMKDAELKEINAHLTNYIETAEQNAISLGTINPKRAKVMAAAYWLVNNPFYRVQYGYGHLSKYNIDGWNPAWSNTVGVECSGFVFWSLRQAGAYEYYSTTTELQHSIEFKDNGSEDFTVNQLIGLGIEPGDILRRSRTSTENGHWSIVMNVNKEKCYIEVAHAVGTQDDTKMTKYNCGTTIKYQHLYKLPAFYQD